MRFSGPPLTMNRSIFGCPARERTGEHFFCAMQAWRQKRARDDSSAAVQSQQRLLHSGSVSRAGLASIIKKLKDPDLPETITLDSLRNAELAAFEAIKVSEMLPRDDGPDWRWEYADPYLLLARALEASPQLQAIYDAAFAASCGEPWHIVVAFDEFTPGSLSKPENRKKCMVLGWNFLDLGQNAMTQELTWSIPVIVRTSEMKHVIGGWSHMLKRFLHRLLFGPYGLATAGFMLSTKQGGRRATVALTAKLWTILSDGDGLRQGLDWKGASGLKTCFKHSNVLKVGSDVAHRKPGYVEASCSDSSQFSPLKKDELEEFVGLIREACARRHILGCAGRADNLQKILGFNFNPHGLLFDDVLRRHVDLIEVFTFDWAHTCLQDGIMNVDVVLYLERCEQKIDLKMEDVMTWLKGRFKFPRSIRAKCNAIWRLFDNHHLGGDGEKLKCQASELLAMYSLLRHYVETVIGDHPALVQERASFEGACKILDLMLLAKRGVIDLADAAIRLRTANDEFLELHKRCYGEEHLKPKHHWMYDVAAAMARDAELMEWLRNWTLVDAFVVERMHLRIRGPLEHIKNTRTLERSILAAVSTDQIRRLMERPNSDGLIGKTHREGLTVYAREIESLSLRICVGDIVRNANKCGEVCACAVDDTGRRFVVVESFHLVNHLSDHSNRWQKTGVAEEWNVARCEQVAAWYFRDDHVVVLQL